MDGNVNSEFQNPEQALNQSFGPKRPELLKIAGSAEIPTPEFKSVVDSCLESVTESARQLFTGLLGLLNKRYAVSCQELAEINAHLTKLQAELQNTEGAGIWSIVLYLGLYIILLIGNVVVFAAAWSIIQPEMPFYVGVFQSIVMVGPSVLISYAYQRSPSKDKFLKYLHWIALSAVILAMVGVAVCKAMGYHLMSAASSGSVLTGASTGSLDKVLLVASTVTFIAVVGSETTLGGRFAIKIYEYFQSRRPAEKTKEDIQECESRIRLLNAEVERIGGRIVLIENFDSTAEAWRKWTSHHMLVLHRALQQQLRGPGVPPNEPQPPLDCILAYSRSKANKEDFQ